MLTDWFRWQRYSRLLCLFFYWMMGWLLHTETLSQEVIPRWKWLEGIVFRVINQFAIMPKYLSCNHRLYYIIGNLLWFKLNKIAIKWEIHWLSICEEKCYTIYLVDVNRFYQERRSRTMSRVNLINSEIFADFQFTSHRSYNSLGARISILF